MPNFSSKSSTARAKPQLLAFFLALCTASAGCNKAEPWDAEFDCEGQEQSIASFADDTADQAVRKNYPFTIDFHLRAKTAMARSSLVRVSSGSDNVMHFEAKGVNVWVKGQFDPGSMQISLVEERLLEIEGRQQQVRISGHYACTPVGATKPTA